MKRTDKQKRTLKAKTRQRKANRERLRFRGK